MEQTGTAFGVEQVTHRLKRQAQMGPSAFGVRGTGLIVTRLRREAEYLLQRLRQVGVLEFIQGAQHIGIGKVRERGEAIFEPAQHIRLAQKGGQHGKAWLAAEAFELVDQASQRRGGERIGRWIVKTQAEGEKGGLEFAKEGLVGQAERRDLLRGGDLGK